MNKAALAHAHPQSPDWNDVQALNVTQAPTLTGKNTVTLALGNNTCFLQVFEHGVRFYSDNQRDYDYGLLVKEVTPQTLHLNHKEQGGCTVNSDDFTIHIEYAPFSFQVRDKLTQRLVCQSPNDGHFVRKHRIPPLSKVENGWLMCFELNSNEAMYGLGEKWGPLNKRGQLIRSYNYDALGVNAEISYKNTPFCWSPEGWGVFVHTPAAVTHAVGYPAWSQRAYCCWVEDPVLDLFLLLKPKPSAHTTENSLNTAAEMLYAYTDLTGRAPMPPSWSGGVILSKAYYQDPQELLSVAKEVRARNMPCDTITIDGRAWQDTETRFAFEWDASRWPDPKSVLDELKAMGFKVCLWEYPLISVKHKWFKLFADNGWLLKDKRTGQAYEYHWDQQAFDRVLTALPVSGIVDFTHPDAYKFWRDAHKPLFEIGVDMIKADFGEQLEDDNMIASNSESGLALHNVYAHLYNRCVYEAASKYSACGPFLFSRSSWTGGQRYNSQWGGDPQADWEGMMGNIRGGLSWGLSGAPFYATDIGGFYKDTRDDALYVRWAQAAVFSAHFRLHGIGQREPWSYSPQANNATMKALNLRYRLQHYLQAAMQQATQTGLPVQRPMVLACPDEKQAWAFENQFMCGNDLLVAPCFSPDGHVEYYLPNGEWLRFNPEQPAGKALKGGHVYSETLALDEMAVFIRVGVSIGLNQAVTNTEHITKDHSGLFVADSYWPAQNE